MSPSVTEHVCQTARHKSFYLASGPADGVPVILMHGWPELSLSWRHQLPALGALGYRAIAPDMRGYGRSSVYSRHEDYALEPIVADMIELLDHLGADKAVWVGHDWGGPVMWSIAQHHPGRCHGVVGLCVPYIPNGFTVENVVPLADHRVYPVETFPAAQWDYQLFYRESFDAACGAFDANPRALVRALFRTGIPEGRGRPAFTTSVRARGGWFGPGAPAPDVPRDASVLTQEDEDSYAEALERNGFFGPDSWYMNAAANVAFARRARTNWTLSLPVLFLHGANDYVCETLDSRLAEPMRDHCRDLTEAVVDSGHWMAQERPAEVNAALTAWLSGRAFASSGAASLG